MVVNRTTRRSTLLPFARPSIGEEEIAEVVDTLRSDWITTGPKVGRFEQEFCAFVGAEAALAVNSCTAALHVALVSLGVGPGDAVISTPVTFCSSIHVIEHVGAHPILVDVERDTLNIDPRRVEAALASTHDRVKALLPVHLYGHPCEMDTLLDIARTHRLAVVEDAAHALPATYKGRMVGGPVAPATDSLPPVPRSAVCFSFYATKNLTTGEGGMFTGDPSLVSEARTWSLHGLSHDAWNRYGRQGSWAYGVAEAGFKYNMSDIQAAIGLHQLRKQRVLLGRRRAMAGRYTAAFSRMDAVQPPTERPEVEHAWHLYPVRLNLQALTIDRGQFIEALRDRNIGTSVHFIPVHLHGYYRAKYGFRPEDFPVASAEYERLISLPLYPRMTDADVEDVIDAVADVIAHHRR